MRIISDDDWEELLANHHYARDLQPVILVDDDSGTAEMFVEVGDERSLPEISALEGEL